MAQAHDAQPVPGVAPKPDDPTASTQPASAEEQPPNQTLYVSHLSDVVKAADMRRLLHTLFSRHGIVLDVVLVETQRMRGQAHIVMVDIPSATRALRAMQGLVLLGKSMRVAYAKGKSYAVAKLDGTYTPYTGARQDGAEEGPVSNGVKRKRELDHDDAEDEDDD